MLVELYFYVVCLCDDCVVVDWIGECVDDYVGVVFVCGFYCDIYVGYEIVGVFCVEWIWNWCFEVEY